MTTAKAEIEKVYWDWRATSETSEKPAGYFTEI
jgi:hypothetical protein